MPENPLRIRAKDHLPTVLLTLLSIVQAFSLELIWAHVTTHDGLREFTFSAVLSWTQIAATFLGVLVIWLIYASLVMRFRWVPTTSDSVFPFLIGIIEFTLIAAMGPHRLGEWFLIMAVIFAVMAWVSQVTLRRARLDDDNTSFFSTIAPAGWRDYTFVLVVVGVFFAAGVYFLVSADQGWFALMAVLVAGVVLSLQLHSTDVFWRRSVAIPPGPSGENPQSGAGAHNPSGQAGSSEHHPSVIRMENHEEQP